MILCANRAGTSAIVRIEIADVQTTTALTAASKDMARGFARMWQCQHCDLFGHVNKVDCKYKHCINVDVDWLNILLQFKRPWQRPRPTQSPQIEVPKHISHKRGPQPKPAAWAAADSDCHRDDARTIAPGQLQRCESPCGTPSIYWPRQQTVVYPGPGAWRTGATLSPSRLSS